MIKRILLVEDEENLHEAIKLNLEIDNYSVTSVFNGKDVMEKFRQGRFDLIILDVMLPELNGFDIAQTIRLENQITPILFLTAKSTPEDKIVGLKLGDDYLTKPFNLEELRLRISNLIRRVNVDVNNKIKSYKLGELHVNFNSFEVHDENGLVDTLTLRQIKLLKLFIEKANVVVSRQEILEKIWGYDVYPSTRTIDNFILVYRKVFEKNLPPSTYFKSIRGVGYKFTP